MFNFIAAIQQTVITLDAPVQINDQNPGQNAVRPVIPVGPIKGETKSFIRPDFFLLSPFYVLKGFIKKILLTFFSCCILPAANSLNQLPGSIPAQFKKCEPRVCNYEANHPSWANKRKHNRYLIYFKQFYHLSINSNL